MSKIKTLRESLGITQAELAATLQISRTTVTMWENDESLPKTAILPMLADALHCKIDDLFDRG